MASSVVHSFCVVILRSRHGGLLVADTSKGHKAKVTWERQAMNLPKLIEQYGSVPRLTLACDGQGIRDPDCGSDSISRIKTCNQLDCNRCRNRFSVTSGTVFHDSHLPLWK